MGERRRGKGKGGRGGEGREEREQEERRGKKRKECGLQWSDQPICD